MSGSKKARATAARLFSVQAVYQALHSSRQPVSLVDEYLAHHVGMDLEDGEMVTPDQTLFKSIMAGVSHRLDYLQDIIKQRVATPEMDLLLKSILLCGIYEIQSHSDIDAPILISDYLHVTHGFYSGSEAKLVNGVLDAVAKEFRAASA